MSVTQFTPAELSALPEGRTGWRFVVARLLPVGLWFLANPWPGNQWPTLLFWTLMTAYSLFCWTSWFHETIHHTLCRSRTANIFLGRIMGIVVFTPYTVYRESHIRHHAYLNSPGDWELWPYSDPNASRPFRMAFAWCDLLLGLLTGPYIYGRIFFCKDSPITSRELRMAIRREYLLSVVFWGATFGLVAWFNVWHGFLVVWLVPHALAGALQTGRKFTEHLGMTSFDPLMGTRTVIGDNLWTRFCTMVNFDIFVHGPHHRHPRLPHAELAGKMHHYVQGAPQTRYPVFSTYSRAVRAMLPALLFNPGVGLNAGGVLPETGSIEPVVADFVSDVCQPFSLDRQSG
jgi:fatty acid desaturase